MYKIQTRIKEDKKHKHIYLNGCFQILLKIIQYLAKTIPHLRNAEFLVMLSLEQEFYRTDLTL